MVTRSIAARWPAAESLISTADSAAAGSSWRSAARARPRLAPSSSTLAMPVVRASARANSARLRATQSGSLLRSVYWSPHGPVQNRSWSVGDRVLVMGRFLGGRGAVDHAAGHIGGAVSPGMDDQLGEQA